MHRFNRWFYLLFVPLAWGATSLVHFRFPGDEYGLWAISSIAGSWVLMLAPNVGDINQPWIRYSVAGAGVIVMFAVGWLLCWLKVRVRVWLLVWGIIAALLLTLHMQQYPSIERALAKNGSWWAYILSATLFAMYVATLIGIVGGISKLSYRKLRKNSAQVSTAKPEPIDPLIRRELA